MSHIGAAARGEAVWLPSPPDGAPSAAPSASAAAPHDPFGAILDGLGVEMDRGEALVHRAMRGGARRDAAELIALQAGIYRYSEAVDLASKLIDRASNAVRTTLQSSGG
jgi:hypothetical protein